LREATAQQGPLYHMWMNEELLHIHWSWSLVRGLIIFFGIQYSKTCLNLPPSVFLFQKLGRYDVYIYAMHTAVFINPMVLELNAPWVLQNTRTEMTAGH
jgi:fucose 4-O-acetylase-like acetyltransferase